MKAITGGTRVRKEDDMAKTIDQTVEFGGVTAERLFNLYMDPEQHKAAIGGPVEIEPHAGGRFSALGGLTGRNLAIESPRLVVQTWRAKVWHDEDPDSVLVLTFTDSSVGARVQLVQANVPDHIYQTIDDGWRRHYWAKWTDFLTS
jgi:uncharacterized protein YndB with AHSA1/START domain